MEAEAIRRRMLFMRRLISGLLAMMLLLCAFPAPAEEGQRAPDYLMEGFDDSTHDWETNLFFLFI